MKVLGLDIGTSSIKSVLLDAGFGKLELIDYHIEPVAPEAAIQIPATNEKETTTPKRKFITQNQIDALVRIFETRYNSNNTPSDLLNAEKNSRRKFEKLIINLPESLITTRVFDFPTKDKKTIQSSLEFELDDELPFEMEKIIYDFAILKGTGNHSSVFTALTLKHELIEILSEIQLNGIDPDVVTTDFWAMSSLLKKTLPTDVKDFPVFVLNLGHKQTTMEAFISMDNEQEPILMHICPIGGHHITRSLAQSFNLSYDDAEKTKLESAFLITKTHHKMGEEITEDQLLFSEAIAQPLHRIVRELKQTLASFKAKYKITPRAIYVTGGTSLIQNLPLFIEESLEIPVHPFQFSEKLIGQTLQLSSITEAFITQATALALCGIKPEKNKFINFRKDEFAKKGSTLNFIDFAQNKKWIYTAAGVMAFIYLNMTLQWFILKSRNTVEQDQLERSIRSIFGAINESVMETYLSSPSSLKQAVQKELAKYKTNDVVEINIPKVSAFDVLNEVSKKIPRNIILDVQKFEIKEQEFLLSGTIDSSKSEGSAEDIIKNLQSVGALSGIQKVKEETNVKTQKTTFEITGKLNPPKGGSK